MLPTPVLRVQHAAHSYACIATLRAVLPARACSPSQFPLSSPAPSSSPTSHPQLAEDYSPHQHDENMTMSCARRYHATRPCILALERTRPDTHPPSRPCHLSPLLPRHLHHRELCLQIERWSTMHQLYRAPLHSPSRRRHVTCPCESVARPPLEPFIHGAACSRTALVWLTPLLHMPCLPCMQSHFQAWTAIPIPCKERLNPLVARESQRLIVYRSGE